MVGARLNDMRARQDREVLRLVEWEKLWRPVEAYGREWLETEPRGVGGIKPLRGWETLRAEGAGEASRHTTITSAELAERHRTPWEASSDTLLCGRAERVSRGARSVGRFAIGGSHRLMSERSRAADSVGSQRSRPRPAPWGRMAAEPSSEGEVDIAGLGETLASRIRSASAEVAREASLRGVSIVLPRLGCKGSHRRRGTPARWVEPTARGCPHLVRAARREERGFWRLAAGCPARSSMRASGETASQQALSSSFVARSTERLAMRVGGQGVRSASCCGDTL